tara:strand:+ start:18444 stop:18668 length:225 start_codon:yes stop_codon:yes gene_type:complete
MFIIEKTSQVFLHMGVAFAVTYAMTGSIMTGGLAALVEPICNVALLPLHEKVWRKIKTRRLRSAHRGNYAVVQP